MPGDMGTIRVPRSVFERHNERRQDLGATWAEYLDGEAPEYVVLPETVMVGRDELREIVRGETRRAIEELNHR